MYARGVKLFAGLVVVAAVAVGSFAGAPGTAYAAKTACGSFTKNGLKVSVYRIRGDVSCHRARRLSHHVIGARCRGEKLVAGFRCYHGAKALGEPAASGYTLKKPGTVIEGRIRSA